MADDDLLDSLESISRQFDFGEYEATAYLTILEHGELTASELSERTDIPQPRVYDTVRSLNDIGLVELQESRPMKVLAIDPEEAFGDLTASLEDLVTNLSRTYTQPARNVETVSLVKSRPTILRYLSDIIDTAEYELMLSLTPDLVARYEDRLREKREEGVATEILISPAAEAPADDEYDYRAVANRVRGRRGVTTPVAAVADGRYSLYATRESLRDDNDRYGVIFDRSELGFMVSMYLNLVLWSTADTITAENGSLTFPRRYGTIRRAVADLADIDGEFVAHIEGRDVVSGERRTIEGQVVEVTESPAREEASFVVETETSRVTVGGQVAAYEDIEALDIRIDRANRSEER
ncbi:MAG: TrmB family transcriptional regulator [Haloarculaceae archaeon]